MSKNLMMVFQILCKSFYNFNCTIFSLFSREPGLHKHGTSLKNLRKKVLIILVRGTGRRSFERIPSLLMWPENCSSMKVPGRRHTS